MSENSKVALLPRRPPVRATGRPFSMTDCEGVLVCVVPAPRVRGGEAGAPVAHAARAAVPAGAGRLSRDVVGRALRDDGGRPARAHIPAHLRSKRRVFTVKSRHRALSHNSPGARG